MGLELGPAFLRRPPKGWIPARAVPLRSRVPEVPQGPEGGGQDVLTTSVLLDVTWRIEAEGRAPYEVEEERRTAPTWLQPRFTGGGNRWYKPRLRPQYGLMADVPVPCYVDPADASAIWIDWDGAYAANEAAWEKQARIDRALADRKGRYEQLWDRALNPFAGRRLQDGEAALVEERLVAERERAAADEAADRALAARIDEDHGVGIDAKAAFDAAHAEETRVRETGRPATAVVVARRATDRSGYAGPVTLLDLDVDDHGTTRRVVYEHVWGPRHAKRYKPGRRIDVRIDPADPGRVALMS